MIQIKALDQHVVLSHANANSLFAIALRITEANKICNILGYEFVSLILS